MPSFDQLSGPRHVLILSASMGAGHDGAARELATRLEAAGHTTETHDYLPTIPLRMGLFIRWFYGMQLSVAPQSYAWIHRQSQKHGWFMRITLLFANLAKPRVRRMIRKSGADVVVSTYPLASQVLGSLREQDRLDTPTVTFMTDFDVHALWVHTHIDVHLAVSEPTARLAESLMGRPSLATGPMVPARFTEASNDRVARRKAVRAELGIASEAVVALTVAGSWGVGDVGLTVRRLTDGGKVTALVICGRNEDLRATLGAMPGVVALGWRTDMPDLMVAADVLVENAGGLTAMEAFAAGLPVISHECIPGHGPANAGAMAAMGVSTWAKEPAELVPSVLRLARGVTTGAPGQVDRARKVFLADPAALVGTLAGGGSLKVAARAAGLHAPATLIPARPSRLRSWRRRARITAATTLGTVWLASSGVAAATSLGVGVAKGQSDHPHEIFVAVRLAPADIVNGKVPASLVSSLRADRAVVAVDAGLVRSYPTALADLGRAGVTIVNGGEGGKARPSVLNANPAQSAKDLVSGRREVASLPGARPWVFVACRHLSAFDLGTSFVADDVLVKPDVDLSRESEPAIRGGKIVLVDARGLPEAALEQRLTSVAGTARARGLAMSSLLDIVRQPR